MPSTSAPAAQEDAFNHSLAKACQDCDTACCKVGQIFLPRDEYERIRAHASRLGEQQAEEFLSRIVDHCSFLLYDQRRRCQFLDARNLCELHSLGLKPSECFWWPYHVYGGEGDALEIRLFIDCCDAFRAHNPESPYPHLITQRAREIGLDVLKDFRRIYPGSKNALRVASLPPADPAVAANLAAPGLMQS